MTQFPDGVDGASLRLLSENRDIYIIQSATTRRGKKSSFERAFAIYNRCLRRAKNEKKIP